MQDKNIKMGIAYKICGDLISQIFKVISHRSFKVRSLSSALAKDTITVKNLIIRTLIKYDTKIYDYEEWNKDRF